MDPGNKRGDVGSVIEACGHSPCFEQRLGVKRIYMFVASKLSQHLIIDSFIIHQEFLIFQLDMMYPQPIATLLQRRQAMPLDAGRPDLSMVEPLDGALI